jgi:hypothetical protein
MVTPQSKNSWFSDPVRARYIELYLTYIKNTDNPLKWDTIHKMVREEFPNEESLKSVPLERTVRAWAQKDPNLPERLKGFGILKEWKPPEPH